MKKLIVSLMVITGLALSACSEDKSGFLPIFPKKANDVIGAQVFNGTVSALPACNSSRLGYLFFVTDPDGDFYYCGDDNTYHLIDLTGPQGDQGDPGDQGPEGDPGSNGTNGTDGADGLSIVWLGSLSTSTCDAGHLNNAYYDTDDATAKICYSTGPSTYVWGTLAVDGQDVDSMNVSGSVAPGYALSLTHGLNRADLTFTAQFVKNGYIYDYTDYAKYFADDVPDSLYKTYTTFETGATFYTSSVRLANGNVFIAYRDDGNSNYGTFTILGPEGDVVKAPTVFYSGRADDICATPLLTGGAMVAFNDYANTDGSIVTISADGNTISGLTDFDTDAVNDIAAVTLPNGYVMIAYSDSGGSAYDGKIVIISAAGVVTVTATQFDTKAYDIAAATLNDGRVLIAYRDTGNSSYGTMCVYSYMGGSLTNLLVPTVFESSLTTTPSVTALKNGNGFIGYVNSANDPCYIITTSSGTVLSGNQTITATSAYMNPGSVRTLANGDVFYIYYAGSETWFAVFSPEGYLKSGPNSLYDMVLFSGIDGSVPLSNGNVMVINESSNGQYAILAKQHLRLLKSSNYEVELINNTEETLDLILSVNQ
jgi:hypothetical protein